MADDENPDGGPEDDGDGSEDTYYDMLAEQRATFRHQMPDPQLQFWAGVVDEDARHDIALSVTLGSLVVTGKVISAAEWTAQFATFYEEAGEPWTEARDTWREDPLHSQLRAVEVQDRRFLHLKDATIWHGRALVRTPTWRARVSEIGSWMFGEVGPVSDEG